MKFPVFVNANIPETIVLNDWSLKAGGNKSKELQHDSF